MNPNPNIFTDPQSPFATAPERVKQILLLAKQDGELNTAAIDLDKLGLELKPTGNNFCSHFFQQNEQCYLCSDCTISNRTADMKICYCMGCWEPQKHVGHDYQKTTVSYDGAYCGCGLIQRFKTQSMCSKHSAYDTIKECEIPQKEGNQFKQTLQSLLQCAVYQQLDNIFLDKILSFLSKINENSMFYNRLTFDVIVKSSKFIKNQDMTEFEGSNTFLIVLLKYQDEQQKFAKLLIHIAGDLLTRINMVKYKCLLYDKMEQCGQNYPNKNILFELINLTIIQKLLEQNFDHKLFDEAIQGICILYEIKIPNKIVLMRLTNLQRLRFLNGLNLDQLSIKQIQEILVKIIEMYPSSQDIRKFMNGQQEQNQQESDKYSYSNLQQEVRKANQCILKLIFILIQGDVDRLIKIRPILQQAGVKLQKLEEILQWIVLGSTQICYFEDDPEKKNYMIILIQLIKQSKNSKQLLERFWNILLETQKSQNDENIIKVNSFTDIFNDIISTLLHSEIRLIIAKIKIQKQENDSQAKLESTSEEQVLANWFKSYLYERKTIPREQMIKLQQEGFLRFKNIVKTLKQTCTYNQDDQTFVFTGSQVQKNVTNQFPLLPIRWEYTGIQTSTLYLGKQINFEGQFSKDLILFVLQADNILPIFDKEWQKYLKSSRKDDGGHKYAYLYLFLLVLYDSLTRGRNKQLRERLQFLRKNKQALNEYTKDQEQIKMIKRLLNIQKVQNKMSEQISPQHPIQQQGQESKPKSNLSLKFKELPENASQCLKKFSKKCKNCKENSYYQCLICGKILCYDCGDKHAQQVHDGITFYLKNQCLSIFSNRGNYCSSDSVYYNKCKVRYEDRDRFQMGDDEYFLSKIKYQKVINKLLSND